MKRPGASPPAAPSGDDLFRVAVLHSSDLVSVHDRGGAVLLASPSLATTLALPADRVSRATLRDLVHPDDAPAAATIDHALAAGESRAVELRLRGRDGSFRCYELRADPWRGEDGALRGFVVHARDVHQRRVREDALRKLLRAPRGDHAADGVVELGAGGEPAAVDARAFELFGLDPHESLAALALPDPAARARRFLELVAGEVLDHETFVAAAARHSALPAEATREDVRLRDGRVLERHAVPKRDAGGRVCGRVLFHRDVTSRRRAEGELRERARQQQALAELGEMAMFAEEPEVLLRVAVRVVADTLDVDVAQVLRLRYEDATLESVASSGGEGFGTAPVAGTQAGEALASGTPVVTSDLSREPRFHDARLREVGLASGICVVLNGRERPFGVVAAHAVEPRIYSGDEVQFLHAAANVLGAALVRHEIAAELRARQEQLRAVFENALEALLTVDDDGTVLEANTAATRLLALPRERIVGQPWNLVFGQDADPAVFLRQLRRRRQLAGETEVRVGDGSVHDVEYAAVADVVPGVHLAALRDLTEQHRMQARLALADRMVSVGTLAAGVAHELNNPLAYVAANLSYVGEQLASLAPELRGDMPDAVREAREGAERMRAIIRDLRTFSRGDDRPRGPVAVAPVLESCIQVAWNELRHRARVVRELAPVPPVIGTEARLGQVFLNLLVNAAQAIPEGDAGRNEIRVTLREVDGGRVAVEIRDTGSGIAAHDLPRIFDPFYTTKAPGVGTGLGLSICHNIVSAAGGTIEVETALGQGSTFRVLLPVSSEGVDRAPEPAAPRAPPPIRARVLVVDDEPLVASAVRRALTAEHDVLLVPGGREALAALDRGERFDLVLSDLLMPDMTGMELQREIAARDPALAERMVFLTGGAFTPGAREFIEAHRADCVEKPFDLDALRELVRRRARAR